MTGAPRSVERVSSWPASDLHDAQLVQVTLDWAAGTARLDFIPHQHYPDQPGAIEARGLRQASFPRRNEWGPSNAVLEARPPERTADGALRLAMSMQSGDELVLIAAEFIPRALS